MQNVLVLVRHGQSIWNKKNLFTGLKNVSLTEEGEAEARKAGQLLAREGFEFDIAFTSKLIRAQRTLTIMLEELGQSGLETIEDQALNERDYGDLVSLDKDEARAKWGVEQVHIWRRSFDTPPPGGESLKDTTERVLPYYEIRNPSPRTGQAKRHHLGPRQFAACAHHAPRCAYARRGDPAQSRHRRADHLPTQRRRLNRRKE